MSDFDQAGRLDSRAAMPHVWRGIIHWRTKKWGLAIAEFKQALEIDREDLDTSLLLATAYVFQLDFGKAIPMISQVIAADPHFGVLTSCGPFAPYRVVNTVVLFLTWTSQFAWNQILRGTSRCDRNSALRWACASELQSDA